MNVGFLLAALLAIFMSAGQAAAAQAPEALFHQANAAYGGGDFPKAIALYHEVLASGAHSANLFLNLGNSYAQDGQVGRAILSYERGLRLSPDDADLQGNLQLLRREKGLFGETVPGWQPLHLLSLDRWALLALAALLFLAIWQVSALTLPWARRWRLAASLVGLVLLLLASTGVAVRQRSYNPSVVVAPDARLLLSPFPAAASVGAIQEGRLVKVEKRHGDYLYVADDNGRRGWLIESQLEAVCREEVRAIAKGETR